MKTQSPQKGIRGKAKKEQLPAYTAGLRDREDKHKVLDSRWSVLQITLSLMAFSGNMDS